MKKQITITDEVLTLAITAKIRADEKGGRLPYGILELNFITNTSRLPKRKEFLTTLN